LGADLAKRLGRLGYEVTRQTGSHLRLKTTEGGQHHVTIPNHDPLKVGTLAEILNDVAAILKSAATNWSNGFSAEKILCMAADRRTFRRSETAATGLRLIQHFTLWSPIASVPLKSSGALFCACQLDYFQSNLAKL
jgi:predicted RNA binding protein YcfA (HicA-like mRNA interferase family)